jgi:hypothetical protein
LKRAAKDVTLSGIRPSSMDAGAFVITRDQAAAVMKLKKANYR